MARLGVWALALAVARVALAAGPAHDVVSLLQQAAAPAVELDIGEKVEVNVEKGIKAGTWVPGTVTRKRMGGYYDVHVQFDPYAVDLVSLGAGLVRRTEDQGAWDREVRFYKEFPGDAKQVVEQLDFEDQRRMRAGMRSKGMSTADIQAKMASSLSSRAYRKEIKARTAGCPAGYKAMDGDARGNDQFGRSTSNRQDTIELCAADCNAKANCRSFEWSPRTTVCNLNKVAEPEKTPHFMDFMFCKRLSEAEIAEAKVAREASPTAKPKEGEVGEDAGLPAFAKLA